MEARRCDGRQVRQVDCRVLAVAERGSERTEGRCIWGREEAVRGEGGASRYAVKQPEWRERSGEDGGREVSLHRSNPQSL